MAEVAAHLTNHVLPHPPVLQIFLRAIRRTLRRTSPGAPPEAQLGVATGSGLPGRDGPDQNAASNMT